MAKYESDHENNVKEALEMSIAYCTDKMESADTWTKEVLRKKRNEFRDTLEKFDYHYDESSDTDRKLEIVFKPQ